MLESSLHVESKELKSDFIFDTELFKKIYKDINTKIDLDEFFQRARSSTPTIKKVIPSTLSIIIALALLKPPNPDFTDIYALILTAIAKSSGLKLSPDQLSLIIDLQRESIFINQFIMDLLNYLSFKFVPGFRSTTILQKIGSISEQMAYRNTNSTEIKNLKSIADRYNNNATFTQYKNGKSENSIAQYLFDYYLNDSKDIKVKPVKNVIFFYLFSNNRVGPEGETCKQCRYQLQLLKNTLPFINLIKKTT